MIYKYTFNTLYGAGEVYYENGYLIKFRFYFEKEIKVKSSSDIPLWVKKLSKDIIKYMAGYRVDFLEYKVNLGEFSEFERKVLLELRKVKYGEVISYKEIGERAGYRNAGRAVGNLMRKNPFPIIIPCHRVIKSDGSIGEYSMGKKYKKLLLDIERAGGSFYEPRR